MIRGRRIFAVALCSRAHFSSAKQMFFFCFPSVAAFTLFPFSLGFFLRGGYGYKGFGFLFICNLFSFLRFHFVCRISRFTFIVGQANSKFYYSMVTCTIHNYLFTPLFCSFFFCLKPQSVSKSKSMRHDKFIWLINRVYKLYILPPGAGNTSDITTVANPSAAFNYHQKCSLTHAHKPSHPLSTINLPRLQPLVNNILPPFWIQDNEVGRT